MINDPNRFKHDRSPYERPTVTFRCGREALWSKPCRRGPNPDGSCGGTTECTPVKNTAGRFECRRPPNAGGPCPEGPTPDGSCSHTHPACQPILTLRTQRGRLAWFAFSLIIGLIAAFLSFTRQGVVTLSPIDPGPLTTKHANATAGQGCVACHAPHDRRLPEWLHAAVTTSAPSTQCLSCHTFGGPALKAHNALFTERPELKDTTCVMCHSEHRGDVDLTRLTDEQCTACHTVKFRAFSTGHPQFSERFPSEEPTAISFDHVAHLNRYFKDPTFAAKAPQSCLACHTRESDAQRHVTTGSFEQSCASCHAAEMAQRDLVLFRLPALSAPIDPALVRAACGAIIGERQASQDTQPISDEAPTPISAFLLGVDADDPEAYSEPMKQLITAMANEGAAPLAAALDARVGSPISPQLLAGLNPEVVKRAACAWAANQEYEPVEAVPSSGWHADELSLRYTPTRHADAVAKRWIEFAVSAPNQIPDPQGRQLAEAMGKQVLSRTRGVGFCLKCHAVAPGTVAERRDAETLPWSPRTSRQRPYTVFSHGVHVNLLGGSQSCVTCHVLGPPPASSAAHSVSSFRPIKKETCIGCHGAKLAQEPRAQVRQDCLLCHTYHAGATITRSRQTGLTSARQPGIDIESREVRAQQGDKASSISSLVAQLTRGSADE